MGRTCAKGGLIDSQQVPQAMDLVMCLGSVTMILYIDTIYDHLVLLLLLHGVRANPCPLLAEESVSPGLYFGRSASVGLKDR